MKYIELSEVNSTNAYLSDLLKKGGVSENTVVYTHSQTKGKGMGNNKWESEDDKNALFSICLSTEVKTEEIFKVSLATSLAIYEYLNSKGVFTNVKWPNDIYYQKKKLGGILIENKLDGDVVKNTIIGIGLNLNQEHFSNKLPNPISLKNITGNDYDIFEVIKDISEAVEKKLDEIKDQDFAEIRLEYLFKLYGFGKILMWKFKGIDTDIAGTIIDVKPNGKIVIQAVSGQICVCDIKEVKMIED